MDTEEFIKYAEKMAAIEPQASIRNKAIADEIDRYAYRAASSEPLDDIEKYWEARKAAKPYAAIPVTGRLLSELTKNPRWVSEHLEVDAILAPDEPTLIYPSRWIEMRQITWRDRLRRRLVKWLEP